MARWRFFLLLQVEEGSTLIRVSPNSYRREVVVRLSTPVVRPLSSRRKEKQSSAATSTSSGAHPSTPSAPVCHRVASSRSILEH